MAQIFYETSPAPQTDGTNVIINSSGKIDLGNTIISKMNSIEENKGVALSINNVINLCESVNETSKPFAFHIFDIETLKTLTSDNTIGNAHAHIYAYCVSSSSSQKIYDAFINNAGENLYSLRIKITITTDAGTGTETKTLTTDYVKKYEIDKSDLYNPTETNYIKNQLVIYNNEIYKAKSETTPAGKISDTQYWEKTNIGKEVGSLLTYEEKVGKGLYYYKASDTSLNSSNAIDSFPIGTSLNNQINATVTIVGDKKEGTTFTPGSTTIKIPEDGWYSIYLQLNLNNTSDNNIVTAIVKAGTQYIKHTKLLFKGSSSSDDYISLSNPFVWLTKNSNVNISLYHSQALTVKGSTSASETYFDIRRVK